MEVLFGQLHLESAVLAENQGARADVFDPPADRFWEPSLPEWFGADGVFVDDDHENRPAIHHGGAPCSEDRPAIFDAERTARVDGDRRPFVRREIEYDLIAEVQSDLHLRIWDRGDGVGLPGDAPPAHQRFIGWRESGFILRRSSDVDLRHGLVVDDADVRRVPDGSGVRADGIRPLLRGGNGVGRCRGILNARRGDHLVDHEIGDLV